MALYRTVSLQFWTDPKVDDEFSPEDKYFYLYLLTNPHTALCGCYEISMKQMCRETGYNEDTVNRLLNRLEKQHEVIRYSPQFKEVLILNWHKYHPASGKEMLRKLYRSAENVKSAEFRFYLAHVFRSYHGWGWVDKIDYKPRPQDSRRSSKYNTWRMAVYRRDGFKCRFCGDDDQIHAHHIKPWADYPDLRFDVDNGITLCPTCHRAIHRKE